MDIEKIVEINGKKYKLEEESEFLPSSGASYHEVEFKTHNYGSGRTWQSWDEVDNTPVLCGKCKGDTFKVSACSSDYESWAYCSCGNKFLLHTG